MQVTSIGGKMERIWGEELCNKHGDIRSEVSRVAISFFSRQCAASIYNHSDSMCFTQTTVGQRRRSEDASFRLNRQKSEKLVDWNYATIEREREMHAAERNPSMRKRPIKKNVLSVSIKVCRCTRREEGRGNKKRERDTYTTPAYRTKNQIWQLTVHQEIIIRVRTPHTKRAKSKKSQPSESHKQIKYVPHCSQIRYSLMAEGGGESRLFAQHAHLHI